MTRILTTSAAAAIILAAASLPASAGQWTPSPQVRGDYGAYRDTGRQPYDAGYRAGLRRGEQAARDRRPMDFQREREYRDGLEGYSRGYGDRNRYRDDYRSGFAQGFREAFDRLGVRGDDRWQQNRGYNRGYERDRGYERRVVAIGFQNGQRDGYLKGLDDLQRRRYPDVNRQKWYRNGDHDYNGRYGPKDLYRVDYRRGFLEGYDRAFREGRRY